MLPYFAKIMLFVENMLVYVHSSISTRWLKDKAADATSIRELKHSWVTR